jgi:hypothetical protein
MDKYVEAEYVEIGYIEGDSLVPQVERTKLRFFVVRGDVDIASATDTVSDMLDEGESAFILMPDSGKSGYVSKTGGALLGGDVSWVEQRLSEMEEMISNLSVSVSMKAVDGTLLATPTVTRDGDDYVFQVPQNLTGVEYDVVLNIQVCKQCE